MKFIEVTDTNQNVLINISQIVSIERISHTDRYNSIIYTTTGEICVKNTYEQLKGLLLQ